MSFIEQIDVIRARANRATPGPWGWFGNTQTQQAYLATQRMGRHFVMSFERWGMRGAQPTFWGGRTIDVDERGMKRINGGEAQKASEIPIYEVAPRAVDKNDPAVYRQDVIGFRNADADFIAHSREDIDWLLKEVDRLTAQIAAGFAVDLPGITAVEQVGWHCEHKYGTPSAGTHQSWNHKKGKLVTEANVSSGMHGMHWPSAKERCPASVPVFIAVDAEAQA